MIVLPYEQPLFESLHRIKSVAKLGFFEGKEETPYLTNCRWYLKKFDCSLCFTRDVGYHSSGWWKNPEYERCWHLSIAFPGGKNKKALKKIINGLFGNDKHKIWVEPPYSSYGKSKEVWHYRLFCNENWLPIIPKGEVYSKELTGAGWKSYSELRGV